MKLKNHPENCLLYSYFDSFQIFWQNIIVNFQGKQTLSSTWQVLYYNTLPNHTILMTIQTTILVINRKYNPSDRFLMLKIHSLTQFLWLVFLWHFFMENAIPVTGLKRPRALCHQRAENKWKNFLETCFESLENWFDTK